MFGVRRPREEYYVKMSCAPFPYYFVVLFSWSIWLGDDGVERCASDCAVKRVRCGKRKRQRKLCIKIEIDKNGRGEESMWSEKERDSRASRHTSTICFLGFAGLRVDKSLAAHRWKRLANLHVACRLFLFISCVRVPCSLNRECVWVCVCFVLPDPIWNNSNLNDWVWAGERVRTRHLLLSIPMPIYANRKPNAKLYPNKWTYKWYSMGQLSSSPPFLMRQMDFSRSSSEFVVRIQYSCIFRVFGWGPVAHVRMCASSFAWSAHEISIKPTPVQRKRECMRVCQTKATECAADTKLNFRQRESRKHFARSYSSQTYFSFPICFKQFKWLFRFVDAFIVRAPCTRCIWWRWRCTFKTSAEMDEEFRMHFFSCNRFMCSTAKLVPTAMLLPLLNDVRAYTIYPSCRNPCPFNGGRRAAEREQCRRHTEREREWERRRERERERIAST